MRMRVRSETAAGMGATLGLACALAASIAAAGPVTLSSSITLAESEVALYAGDDVTVSGSNVVLTLTNSATYGALPVYQFGSLLVTNGASVVGLSQGGMTPYTITNAGVAIQSAGDIVIAGGCSINADGRGFGGGNGPGAATVTFRGATHGGRGINNTAATYGSATAPTSLGSGSYDGSGGAGGGALKLVATGNLLVNGTLSANGGSTTGFGRGGGAGGSLWIAGGTLGGTGEVQVSGGTGYDISCGGGGGRLSIDDTVTCNFRGNVRGSQGPQKAAYGGAGSVYIGTLARQNFTVWTNQTVILGNDIENVFGNLTIYGTLIPGGSYNGLGTGAVIRASNVTVAASGSINADYWGSVGGAGYVSGAGGTHAGLGQGTTTSAYGSVTAPTSLGSGGGGNYNDAPGGGAVHLIVSDTLNVLGPITANGFDRTYSGGSGGSIWLEVGTLSGTNAIRADGATAYYAAAGGGGRIAILYGTSTFTGLPAPGTYTNQQGISSTVTVKGGYNTSADGVEDGSIYIGARPAIAVGSATNPAAGTVSLLASLTSTGGSPTTVFGYWGTHGASWDFTTNLGVCGTGTITNTVTGVTPDTLYTFAFMASNAAGTTATGTNTFSLASVTLATAPAGLNVGADSATNATPWTAYWLAGSAHALSVPGPQTNGTARYLFSAWSDGGAQSHSYTASVSATVTAQFTTQYLWSVTVAPPGAGSVTPGTLWTNAGAAFTATATPVDGNWTFDHWSGDIAGTAAATNITMNSGLVVTANFAAAGNAITIGSSPAGRSVVVDGVATSDPPAYVWQNGSVHTVAVASATQPLDSSNRYTFVQWEDGTTGTQRVLTVSGSTNLTAAFQREYLWSWTATPSAAGYVTPASDGWYATGATFTATAVATGTAPFKVWSGDASGTATNVAITMSGPKRVAAAFYIPPTVDNGGGATNIGLTNATLRAALTGGDDSAVSIYWWPNGGPTNVVSLGTASQGVPLQTNVVGLTYNTTYYYQAFATNPAGPALAAVTNFATLPFLRITNSLTLVESQTNLYAALPVVLDGSGVVLTLSNSPTYGNLAVYQFLNLIVTNGASVVGLGQNVTPYDANAKGVAIQSAGDVVIAGGCSIHADATGFAPQQGPGSGTGRNVGGTHGGIGLSNTKTTYGSAANPTTLGSGGNGEGGSGQGIGGGALKLVVAGNLTVNGRLSANGAYGRWGGGAGGSLWITGGCTLGGTGEVQVSGGQAENCFQGPAGGGRVSLDDTVTCNFRGNLRGSIGSHQGVYGGAGSVYIGTLARQNFTVWTNQTVILGNDIENVFGNLTIYGTLIPGGSYNGPGTGVVIRASNVTVAASGRINADYWGSVGGAGYVSGAGGTHAGLGQGTTTSAYGSVTAPTSLGSGGGGSYNDAPGGGAVHLIVSDTLNVLGPITANGYDRGYSGGSGGSIWLEVGTLSGTSVIRADGATASYATAGGGGRIAILYGTSSFTGLPAPGTYTNQEGISSTVTVKGGYNTSADGVEDGSIYIGARPTLAVSNATQITAYTAALLANLSSTGGLETTVMAYWGTNTAPWTWSTNLGVCGTGTITNPVTGLTPGTTYSFAFAASNAAGVTTTAISNFTSTAGTPPLVDNVGGATGVANTSAWMNGRLTALGSATARMWVFWDSTDRTTNKTWTYSHDFGDQAATNDFSWQAPSLNPNTTYWYTYYASNSAGYEAWPAAGSVPFKTAGPPGVDNGAGASGIGVQAATLNGTLTNGGSAYLWTRWWQSGSGPTNTIDFGMPRSEGAFATNIGGLAYGTTYAYQTLASNVYGMDLSPVTNFSTLPYYTITGSVTLTESQAGLYSGLPVVVSGTNTVLTLAASATYGSLAVYQFLNLIVTNGASVAGLGQNVSPYDANAKGVAIQSAGDVVIAGGCNINADGRGFASQQGPGSGTAGNVGGTHGGIGLNNTKATYGSSTGPTTLGSGGNTGSGGGALKLIVAGNLSVNGQLSANGAYGSSGGGAGGSLWITGGCTLGGTGEVQVSGGPGTFPGNGPGGGGRLSIDDTVAACNFRGNIRGANGTLIYNADTQPPGHLQYAGGAGSVYFGTLVRQSFTVYSNQTVVVGNDITNAFGDLTVYGTLVAGGAYAGDGTGVVIRANNLTVAPGGQITASGWGFGTGMGPAPGIGNVATNGGNHGGLGSGNGGAVYGSITMPTSMGSGESPDNGYPCGTAGGAIKLVVSGTLTIDGAVSASGWRAHNGIGGAGGSLWIDTGALAGTGSIRADAPAAGVYGSGGGRIAIRFAASSFTGLPAPGTYTNQQGISSTVTVRGGYNTSADGPEDGSIFVDCRVRGTVFRFR